MRDENCPDCLKLTSGDCGKHSGTYFETKTIEDRLKTLEDKINKYEPHIINLIADTPIGVSQWKEEGIKRGYWDYFKKEVKDEIIKEINKNIAKNKNIS